MYPPLRENVESGPIPTVPIGSFDSFSSITHTKCLICDVFPERKSVAFLTNQDVSDNLFVHLNDMYLVATGSEA